MKRAGEFELINAFLSALPHPRAPRGPGDDAAVLPPSRDSVCITTDAVVEDVHFTRPLFSLADIGHKALAVNLSDLAAMGARPTWWLCALGLPKDFTRAEVVALARGMEPLAKAHRLALIGGNITASKALTLTITLAGEARRPLLRSGARPGDLLFVSGALGAAAAGLSRKTPALVAAQKRPQPQVKLGLGVARWASAAIDVSDGLIADLGHLCASSKVGANVHSSAVPIHPALRGSIDALHLALTGGEDYQLLITVPPRHAARVDPAFTRIGEITKPRAVTLDGQRTAAKGFDHFRSR
jgi:thiamine-monophosphate kinase